MGMLRLNRNHLSSIFGLEVTFGLNDDTTRENKIWAVVSFEGVVKPYRFIREGDIFGM